MPIRPEFLRVFIVLLAAVLGGCSGQLPPFRGTNAILFTGGSDGTETEITIERVENLNGWLAENRQNWTREWFSLPPYPNEAVVMLRKDYTEMCAFHIYSESVVIMYLGEDGSLWSKKFRRSEMQELKDLLGMSD
jgi:hypothetical protein